MPTDCRDLADVVAREHGNVHKCLDLAAPALLRLLERCDALRKPRRFDDVLLACECDARGRLGRADDPYPQRARLREALDVALAVDASAAAAEAMARGLEGPKVGEAVRAARLRGLEARFQTGPRSDP